MKKKKTGTTKKLGVKARLAARKKSLIKRRTNQVAYKKAERENNKGNAAPKKKK